MLRLALVLVMVLLASAGASAGADLRAVDRAAGDEADLCLRAGGCLVEAPMQSASSERYCQVSGGTVTCNSSGGSTSQ